MDTTTTTASNSSALVAPGNARGSIQRLAKHVVDRIAAGEVVQRPSAAVKELLENCLDAKSTHILVHIEHGGLSKIMISDNGCGICKDDLGLAATRFCTSKLSTEEDFETLSTFGFRGEALASMSMVSRLSITSRIATSPMAFSQEYLNGEPQLSQPKPCARPVGTTVTCQDLFYNLPQRKKLREREEYQRVLQTVQYYAIQYAGRGVAMVCQQNHKKNSTVVDLNTTNCIPKGDNLDKLSSDDRRNVTKKVLAQVFHSKHENRLLFLDCSSDRHHHKGDVNKDDAVTFQCTGFLSDPSYESGGSGTLILFVNDRLVECPPLKRALENAYVESTKSKPFLYVSLHVPPTQVDVNVHPTKRQVTLLHLDDICNAMQCAVKALLSSKQDHAFSKSSVESVPIVNPYIKRKRSDVEKEDQDDSDSDEDTKTESRPKRDNSRRDSSKPQSSQAKLPVQPPKKLPPSKLIRTSKAAPSGAIEPFLVRTQCPQRPLTPSTSLTPDGDKSSAATASAIATQSPISSTTRTHQPCCPLAASCTNAMASKVDMTQPGAFADALRSCTCPPPQAVVVRQPRQAVIRPSRVIPTPCSYSSIISLRKLVTKMESKELSKNLREAIFCGVVSHNRSLVQCGMELVLWNHFELAQELFYQLSLARFGGGSPQAKLGGPIDVQVVIAQTLELEDQLQRLDSNAAEPDESLALSIKTSNLLSMSDTNEELARQAATCLLEHAEMLLEYFSIRIERAEESARIVLSGLPVLLEGHSPPPHGLPVFLLRLATEVDWTEEQACFQGICRELGAYYAQVPLDDQNDDSKNHNNSIHHLIQHCLFPAISYLLLPPKRFCKDGIFCQLTALPVLYRVFERC